MLTVNHVERSQNYWREKLSGEIPIIAFPTDFIRPSLKSTGPDKLTFTLENEYADSFHLLLKSKNCDITAGLFSLVNVLLFRYTSQEDMVIGISDSAEIKPLRSQIDGKKDFIELLKQNQLLINEVRSHRYIGLKNLVTDLALPENKGRHPVFDVAVSVNSAINTQYELLDLLFAFNEYPEGITLTITYDGALFKKSTIDSVWNHLTGLLRSIISNPSAALEHLEFLSADEKNELLVTFNNTTSEYPKHKTIVQLFEEQVVKTPDHIALVFEDRKLTYKELNEATNRLGDYLKLNYKIKPDDLVGVKLERSEWLVIAILGVMKSGGAYVPLDPEYPEDRTRYIIEDSGCRLVIDETELKKYKADQREYNMENLLVSSNPDNLLYLIYTSGSTGKPKAVMISHRNMVNYIHWFIHQYNIISRDSTMLLSSVTFDGVKTSIFGALLSGASLHVLGKNILQLPANLAGYINDHAISFLKITPPLLNLLISGDESFNRFAGSESLRLLVVGGEKINMNDIKKIKRKRNDIVVINHYGPTETTVGVSTKQIDDPDEPVTIGKPISNTQLYILNSVGELQPEGVFGELCISGAGVANGYLNKPELTNEKFVPNPFNPGARMYRTGDVGRWLKDGTIEFAGRRDHQVKIRGYRIELGEIEAAIRQYEPTEDIVVLANEEKNGEFTLLAFIVSKQSVNFKELRNYLENVLPNFMIPSFFMQLDSIPLTLNGKIDRKKLLDEKKGYFDRQTDINPPASEEELLIADIWSDLLGIKVISKTADFFELGGHSLIAIRMIAKLESQTGFRLPMASIFGHSTIEKMAMLLKTRSSGRKWKCLVPIKPNGHKMPLYIIHGGGLGVLYFNDVVKYLDDDQPVYGLQALGMEGEDEPLKTVEEMASLYISEIEDQNPEGPYHIAGLCVGTVIAFEISRQFKNRGKVVSTLNLFDYNVEGANKSLPEMDNNRNEQSDFVPKMMFYLNSYVKNPQKHLKYYLRKWELRFISMKNRLGLGAKPETDTLHLQLYKAMDVNRNAIKNYVLHPAEVKINLFVSTDKIMYEQDMEFLGWKPLALKGINRYEVKGDRNDMLLPPFAELFAVKLQRCLDFG